MSPVDKVLERLDKIEGVVDFLAKENEFLRLVLEDMYGYHAKRLKELKDGKFRD